MTRGPQPSDLLGLGHCDLWPKHRRPGRPSVEQEMRDLQERLPRDFVAPAHGCVHWGAAAFMWICRDFDGASRTRTGGLLGAIQALSQLSYSPVARPW